MHTQQPVSENNYPTSEPSFPFHGLNSPSEHRQPIKIFTKKRGDLRLGMARAKTNHKKPTLLCTDGHKTLAGGIAHNFNNILMGMNGYIELMLLNPDSSHYQRLKKIKAHIFYGSSRIQAFLAYARSRALDATGRVSKGAVGKKTFTCIYETFDEDKSPADGCGRVGSMTLEMAADVIVDELTQVLYDIRSNTRAISKDLSTGHDHCEFMQKIEKLLNKGTDMTVQLLQCVRKTKLNKKPVRMNWLVTEAMDTFGGVNKKVKVRQNFSDDLMEVMADPCQLEQIIQNLFINATDAMPCGGEFFIEASNVKMGPSLQEPEATGNTNYILLMARDTGTGMDKATCDQIFEPFFSTKGLKGRGLGLSSVYGIVRAHGGRIDVDSKPEHGTTFKIYLPAIRNADQERFLATG